MHHRYWKSGHWIVQAILFTSNRACKLAAIDVPKTSLTISVIIGCGLPNTGHATLHTTTGCPASAEFSKEIYLSDASNQRLSHAP